MAWVFAQYCIDRNLPFRGFDSDRSRDPFMRFYQSFTEHGTLEDFQSLDRQRVTGWVRKTESELDSLGLSHPDRPC